MKTRVADLDFELLIPYEQLEKRIREIAKQIGEDFEGRSPIIAGILTGSFLFVADLVKNLDIPVEVTFTKLASYFGGTASTRKIRDDFDLTIDIKGRHLILVEDIVDTGNTLHYLVDKLRVREPATITVCTLLLKPNAIEVSIEELKYVGFEIDNQFVVGYGLDYREQGRSLMGIYQRVG